MSFVFRGRICHSLGPDQLEILPDALLGVKDGTITFLFEADHIEDESFQKMLATEYKDAERIQLTNEQFLTPSFCDVHIHAPQFPLAGFGMDVPLLEWLQKYALPTEHGMADLKRAEEVYSRVVRQTLRQGTTTACYFSSIHAPATKLLAEICFAAGQRAFIGKCNMNTDLSPEWYRETSEGSLADTKECIAHCRQVDPAGDFIKPIITPRFVPSCSSDLLRSLGDLAREENLPIQTHISENAAEVTMVGELFPQSAHYTGVYDDHGLLTDKTILAHAILLSDAELKLIKERDAGIAHCPASNTALQSGEAPIREMLDLGIKVGLGTDVSGGYTASVLDQARLACGVSRHRVIHTGDKRLMLSVDEAMYMATLGGAKVCGQGDRLGNFLVGKCFDALLIDLSASRQGRVEIFEGEEDRRLFDKWVFNGDDRNIQKIWVDGRQVL